MANFAPRFSTGRYDDGTEEFSRYLCSRYGWNEFEHDEYSSYLENTWLIADYYNPYSYDPNPFAKRRLIQASRKIRVDS